MPEDDDATDPRSAAIDAYALLRDLEIVLRELIITELESLGDSKWWKRRVPNDVQHTATQGQQYERSTRWLDASTYHPIYYTDFADIRKIVTNRSNWSEVFGENLYNKDQLTADLQSLEPIRNSIAHSRMPSPAALDVLRAVYTKIKTSIGNDWFERLARQHTVVRAAVVLPKMLSELSQIRQTLHALETVDLSELPAASTQWWWDANVLGGRLENVDNAISLVFDYNALPRGRGQGHILEAWVSKNQLLKVIDAATSDLEAILAGNR